MVFRRTLPVLALVLVLLFAACTNKHVQNPLADVGSAQPDKVLFDRAMDAMKHNRFDVARMTLQTLINTYPDSEFLARAKLAVGDSWYAAGGSAAFAQAEAEYKDFITFFPNMAEASEAQLKIANIHYRQMHKADRDYTHAMRAEQEYRNLLLQYPDSPLTKDAKLRLMEVQEVLAEREFRIGRFYFMRQSWAAAVARLKSIVDTYPLYSGADEALFLLGQSYEGQVDAVRAANLLENAKGEFIKRYTDEAAKAYARIITRYPAMERAGDARLRLQTMERAVPEPTQEAIEQNQREQASRGEAGMFGKLWGNFSRHPDTTAAARIGEPTLADPKQTSAPALVKQANDLMRSAAAAGNNSVSVETVKTGEPPPNQPLPRSGAPAQQEEASPEGIPELLPLAEEQAAPAGSSAQTSSPASQPAPEGIPELVPLENANGGQEVQSAAPVQANQAPAAEPPRPAPPQVNEAAAAPEQQAEAEKAQPASTESSSSRPKKKKGFLGVF